MTILSQTKPSKLNLELIATCSRVLTQELEAVSEQKGKFEAQRDDYARLRDKLRTLPDEIEYEVFVPIAGSSIDGFEYTSGGLTVQRSGRDLPLAFMPGKLVHTNEVLVHLGDNWFAHRSAKQSAEIAERRVEQYGERLEAIEKSKQQITDWLTKIDELANDRQQLVEINEEFDEEEERKWRERHRESVRKQKELERQQREAASKRKDEAGSVQSLQKDFTSFGLSETVSERVLERDPAKGVQASSGGSGGNASTSSDAARPISKFKQQMLNKRK